MKQNTVCRYGIQEEYGIGSHGPGHEYVYISCTEPFVVDFLILAFLGNKETVHEDELCNTFWSFGQQRALYGT